MSPDHVNRHELRVVGMSRSGNHAIIDWILSQASGRICSLNCAEPKTNPFLSARPLSETEPPCWANYAGFDPAAEAAGRLSPKDYLLHSYEDVFLGSLTESAHEDLHDSLVGSSRRRIDVLILRDPFNLFASRLAAGIGHVRLTTASKIWCQHAREFMGVRRHLRNERVMVAYNDWVSSRDYREELAGRLGLGAGFDDSLAHAVPAAGGGSSFDGIAFSGRAGEMRVFERWRNFASDPVYRSIFTAELLELSDEIFGRSAREELSRAA